MPRSFRFRFSFFSGLVLLGALVSGCSDDDYSPSGPSQVTDSITIQEISPAAGTTLNRGTNVTFTARIGYSLGSASTGRIALVAQDQAGSALAPQPFANVPRGSGTVSLSQQVTIPAQGVTRVDVFFPLLPDGASRSTAARSAQYPVQ